MLASVADIVDVADLVDGGQLQATDVDDADLVDGGQLKTADVADLVDGGQLGTADLADLVEGGQLHDASLSLPPPTVVARSGDGARGLEESSLSKSSMKTRESRPRAGRASSPWSGESACPAMTFTACR